MPIAVSIVYLLFSSNRNRTSLKFAINTENAFPLSQLRVCVCLRQTQTNASDILTNCHVYAHVERQKETSSINERKVAHESSSQVIISLGYAINPQPSQRNVNLAALGEFDPF